METGSTVEHKGNFRTYPTRCIICKEKLPEEWSGPICRSCEEEMNHSFEEEGL